jgi:hypothetical protein
MNTTQAISICSNALMLLGHDPITSFDEEGIGAKVASNFYESSLRSKLADYNWKFATKKTTLSKLAQTPINGWDYVYQLPTDHIRTITTYPHSDYEILGDKIYSSTDDLQLDYVHRVDETYFPPAFREMVELYLAAKWAIPVTENSTAGNMYYNLYVKQIKKAKAIDSLESPNKAATEAATLPVRMRNRTGRR